MDLKLPKSSKVLGENGLKTAHETQELKPDAGFVMKLFDKKSGEKIFVNICQSTLLPDADTRTKICDNGQEEEGLNVPLSLGPLREAEDRSGKTCVVCDIVVNPNVLERLGQKNKEEDRSWFINFCLSYLSKKYEIELDEKIIYPRIHYKFDKNSKLIPIQLIRKPQKNKVEAVEEIPKSVGCICTRQTISFTSSLSLIRKNQKLQALDPELQTPQIVFKSEDIPQIEEAAQICWIVQFSPNNFLSKSKETPFKVAANQQYLKLIPKECEFCNTAQFMTANQVETFLPIHIKPQNVKTEYNSVNYTVKVFMKPDVKAYISSFHLVSSDYGNLGSFNLSVGIAPDIGTEQWKLGKALSGNAVPSNAKLVKGENTKDDDILEFAEEEFHSRDPLSIHFIAERARQEEEKKKAEETRQNNAKLFKVF